MWIASKDWSPYLTSRVFEFLLQYSPQFSYWEDIFTPISPYLYFLKEIIHPSLDQPFRMHTPWFWGNQCHRDLVWNQYELGHGHRTVQSRGRRHRVESCPGYLYHLSSLLFHLMKAKQTLTVLIEGSKHSEPSPGHNSAETMLRNNWMPASCRGSKWLIADSSSQSFSIRDFCPLSHFWPLISQHDPSFLNHQFKSSLRSASVIWSSSTVLWALAVC